MAPPLVEVASCVWRQYFTEETDIGVPSQQSASNSTGSCVDVELVDEKHAHFQAALAFRDAFQDQTRWAPLLEQVDLTQRELGVVWLHHGQLVEHSGIPHFASCLQEESATVLACLGIALCMVRHEQRQEMEETPARKRAVPLDKTKLNVRLRSVTPVLPLESLKADVVNQFVGLVGTVVRVSAIKPLVVRCDFECSKCGSVTCRAFPDGKFNPPTKCDHPGCRSRTLQPKRSTVDTVDYQKIKLQEMDSNDAGPGRIPRVIEVELYEDLVDSCIPGNVVAISGVIKSINSEVHSGRFGKRAQTNSLSILYMSANAVENTSKNERVQDKTADIDFTKEDLEQISQIISDGDVFDRLIHSLCPGIYRNEIVKAGLLLALLGGTHKPDEKESTCFSRSDSHVLIVGDPGLGKSQMLRAVASVAPRAVYVCGNTTTTTGLTVTMVKDSSGDYALEAGALVLADQGVCCIDEFDKMGIDYQALLEAMEQQSISIAKAGIVCTLNARTSVIAAANPAGGHYNTSRTVSENLKIKGALLSRFDLVFILLDRPDEERDRLLSEHIMQMHTKKRRRHTQSTSQRLSNGDPLLTGADLDEMPSLAQRLKRNSFDLSVRPIPIYYVKKFIAYAKRYIHPRLSLEAARLLQRKYLEMRQQAQDNSGEMVPVTTRQLESLLRLAQARAKADLSEIVTMQHAQDVVDIMQECLAEALACSGFEDEYGMGGGRNAKRGGRGMSLAKKVKAYVARLIKVTARRHDAVFSFEELLEVADSMALQVDDFRDFVDILRNECYLLKKGPNQYKVQVSSYSQSQMG